MAKNLAFANLFLSFCFPLASDYCYDPNWDVEPPSPPPTTPPTPITPAPVTAEPVATPVTEAPVVAPVTAAPVDAPVTAAPVAGADVAPTVAPTSLPEVDDKGMEYCDDHGCGLCQGDCDSDSQCEGDLKCFQREASYVPVPGCSGGETEMAGKYTCCFLKMFV